MTTFTHLTVQLYDLATNLTAIKPLRHLLFTWKQSNPVCLHLRPRVEWPSWLETVAAGCCTTCLLSV